MRLVSKTCACAAVVSLAGCASIGSQNSASGFASAANSIAAQEVLASTSISQDERAVLLAAFAPVPRPPLRMDPPLPRPERN
ncbi:MAG: hypothetical protein AAF367_16545 [Pseudomonadota bacterium]